MHPKDPIPDAQKTDIIYHWKCPAHNCTAEYIGEANRSLKERVSDHINQPTTAIRSNQISTKHLKAELKDSAIIERQQCPSPWSKASTSHLYQRSITQQKHWQSQNPFSIQQTSQTSHTTRTTNSSSLHLLYLLFQHKRQLTFHTFLFYNRSVIFMFTPFKL